MNQYLEERNEQGFTLIELLIAIVVVGILTAVAIVGIAGLTNNGSKSACAASRDAAKAATAVFYANNSGTYPQQLSDMSSTTPPIWEPPTGITPTAGVGTPKVSTIATNGWTLTMTAGATATDAPTFVCT
jgi:type IV pilus assembly protein PilA